MTRRHLLLALPALAAWPLAPSAFAQASRRQLRVRAFNHMTLRVSDVRRSLEFYQRMFGMPIQARQGTTVCLRIGAGPQFLALSEAGAAEPQIDHFCLTVEAFETKRVLDVLAEHGVTNEAATTAAGEALAPMRSRIRMRGPEAGGAQEGSAELYFGDPDGIRVQLQDPRYCGGAGSLGDVCGAPERSPTPGALAVRDLNHFTIAVSNPDRTNQFYQGLFGFGVQAMQAATPALGVGAGEQFLMFTGGAAGRGGAPPRPPRIDHACLNMENFNPSDVLKKLESVGIKPRGDSPGPPGPLVHYISMRMPNRGGAPGGTPELYFTDPDGLAIQLQDVRYCGGGGTLGEICV